ncbi:MAG: transglycosylase SLT domain-containing protein [Proteobacteria bacterium]|nr:transglycosylase SLT domain-containing protein [Pseudomonadota bacterium]
MKNSSSHYRCAAVVALALVATPALAQSSRAHIDTLIATHARANGVPESLVRRVIMRESRYNPRAVGRGGATGLMQIKYATARALGYRGSAAGLLDADTNLTYAVRYLAGAYRVAGGNAERAAALYRSGYRHHAKRQAQRTDLQRTDLQRTDLQHTGSSRAPRARSTVRRSVNSLSLF